MTASNFRLSRTAFGLVIQAYKTLDALVPAMSVILPAGHPAARVNYFLFHADPWKALIDAVQQRGFPARALDDHVLNFMFAGPQPVPFDPGTEFWGAGCTYKRSKVAREEESADSGGAKFYDKVYSADRPELFPKSTYERASGHDGIITILPPDESSWMVPEPELGVVPFFDPATGRFRPVDEIVGMTICDDMSSRDVEGDNPLYLPQAKGWDGSNGVGPCFSILRGGIPEKTGIKMRIIRKGREVFKGETTVAQMNRKPQDLLDWLGKHRRFPNGVVLSTGTGTVPEGKFTLEEEDEVTMTIDGVGVLKQTVAIAS